MKKLIYKHKVLFSISVILTITDAIATVYFAFILKMILDSVSLGSLDVFRNVIIFSVIYLFASITISYLRNIFQSLYIRKTLIDIKNEIFRKILGKSFKSFYQENTAAYISVVTNDINLIEQDYLINKMNLIYNGVSFIIALFSIVKISIPITISVIAVSIFPLLISTIFKNSIAKSKKMYSDALSVYTTKVKDIFSGFEVIKSFKIENKTLDEHERSNILTEDKKYKYNVINIFADTLSSASGSLIFLVALGFGTYLVIKNRLTIGEMIATVQLINHIVNPLVTTSQKLNRLNSVKLIENKISDLIDENQEVTTGLNIAGFEKNISFENITFTYDNNKNILEHINLKVNKGQKIAIVGESGSGKSTILRLLLRYYDNYIGTIKIDDTNILDIGYQSLYSLISMIHQNVFMFDSSIKDNITLFSNYDEDEVLEAVKKAGLSNYINSHQEGLESNVGENGCYLSGGERQRIAIARALLKRTPILILDEATSSLDNETSYSIENQLLSIDNLTCIVVTHKLIGELLKKYDQIVVIKNGQIVESGDFYQLMEQKGYFYSLYNIQVS